ncbi:Chitinase 1 [Mortierella sp. NVP85]|nr:Chitinase 1 [Mortierella sp. NVP85]
MLTLGVFSALLLSISLLIHSTEAAFDIQKKTNVVSYWGQGDARELALREYCNDDTFDVIMLAFLVNTTNNTPALNFASHCDTRLPTCDEIGKDITYCQEKGKAMILSIGGATGDQTLATPEAGTAFAQVVWDMFFEGTSTARPFGTAILDGFDLDLEQAKEQVYTGHIAFVDAMHAKFTQSPTKRRYYITSAPQCVYPDASLGAVLDSTWMDMVFVQFYNNGCGPRGGPEFNFHKWNEWATGPLSKNKDVKIYLGVPGGPDTASNATVLDPQQLTDAINVAWTNSSFGGVMLWNIGAANATGLAKVAGNVLQSLSQSGTPNLPPAIPTTTNATVIPTTTSATVPLPTTTNATVIPTTTSATVPPPTTVATVTSSAVVPPTTTSRATAPTTTTTTTSRAPPPVTSQAVSPLPTSASTIPTATVPTPATTSNAAPLPSVPPTTTTRTRRPRPTATTGASPPPATSASSVAPASSRSPIVATTSTAVTGASTSIAAVPTTTMPFPNGKGPIPTITIMASAGATARLAVHMAQAPTPTTTPPQPTAQAVAADGDGSSLTPEARGLRYGGNKIVAFSHDRNAWTGLSSLGYPVASYGDSRRRPLYGKGRFVDPRAPTPPGGMNFVIEAICQP